MVVMVIGAPYLNGGHGYNFYSSVGMMSHISWVWEWRYAYMYICTFLDTTRFKAVLAMNP
jgi:hypothetical protein